MAISRGHRSGRKFTSNIDTPHIKVDKQTVEEFTVSPDMMETIKEALVITLKDKGLLKDTIIEILRNEPNIIEGIQFETAKAGTTQIIGSMEDEPIEIRSIDRDDAKKEIEDYIKKNAGCLISDIVKNLRIDPDMVFEIIKEFKKDNLLTDRLNESE